MKHRCRSLQINILLFRIARELESFQKKLVRNFLIEISENEEKASRIELLI